jgi:Fanconi anemia group M protein
VPDLLVAKDCAVEMARLECGDYLLSASLGVERKSSRDFVDSLLSGRLFDQLERLSASECAALLIEGDAWSGDRRLKTPMLGRLYDWISFHPNVNVLYSPNEKWTARLLVDLAHREQTTRSAASPQAGSSPVSARTPRDVVLALPGVGPANADRLLDRFGTIQGIVSATESQLALTVGSKRGAQIFAIANQQG